MWGVVKIAHSWAHPSPTESEILKMGTAACILMSLQVILICAKVRATALNPPSSIHQEIRPFGAFFTGAMLS